MGEPEQSMIFIMGLSGSGKSRFVNLLRQNSVREGAGLQSETQECQIVQLRLKDKLVSVVDTPGFGDSRKTDAEILSTISDFLILQHAAGFRLSGIIWLHPIEQQRMRRPDLQALTMFHDLCGKDALSAVTLLTTRWDHVKDERTGAMRERELRRSFWKDMIDHGANAQRFNGSSEMAKSIVRRLLRNKPVILQIQKDSMESGKRLRDTAAGARIMEDLEVDLKRQEEKVKKAERELKAGAQSGDQATEQALRTRYEAEARERERLISSCQRMNANLGQEIMEKWDRIQEDLPQAGAGSDSDSCLEHEKQVPNKGTAPKIENTRRNRWKGRVSAFANVLGLTLTAVVHIVLPLAGIAVG
ncbi:hypothetical protein QC764_121860 [Podospora pseudoanserina]|nr:hypothetical protein QC764_121860 [Podospora pseudoanserina]